MPRRKQHAAGSTHQGGGSDVPVQHLHLYKLAGGERAEVEYAVKMICEKSGMRGGMRWIDGWK